MLARTRILPAWKTTIIIVDMEEIEMTWMLPLSDCRLQALSYACHLHREVPSDTTVVGEITKYINVTAEEEIVCAIWNDN